MVVGMISVVMPVMIVAIVLMVVAMMIAVPRCGWNRATAYYCADNA
jgi:hypothetical protein